MSDQVAIHLRSLELPDARVFRREPYVVAVAGGELGPPTQVTTAPAKGVRAGHPADLGPGGVVLYGPRDPGAFVALRLVVMESDRGFRRAGEIIDGLRGHLSGTALGASIAAGVGLSTSGVAGVVLREGLDLVANRLRAAGDDQLAAGELVLQRPEGGWVPEERRWRLAGVTLGIEVVAPAPAGFAESEPLVEEAAEELAAGADPIGDLDHDQQPGRRRAKRGRA